MHLPPLDNRTAEEILEQLRELAAAYVPEWNPGDETDPAAVLTRIFSELFADTLQRYNKMPYKHYLFLLNLLGARRLPGLPAQGNLTVSLNPGDYPGVRIKRGTRLYRKDGERILYETTGEMYAVNNELTAIYCCDRNRFCVVRPYRSELESKEAPRPFHLFDFAGGQNLQRFGLLLSEKHALHTPQNAIVEIAFFHRDNSAQALAAAKLLGNESSGAWRYLSCDGWQKAEQTEVIGNQIRLLLRREIALAPCLSSAGRWLSFSFTQRPPDDALSFTDLRLASRAGAFEPDRLYNNDRELDACDFLPFGERFSPYDDFYIASDVAFSKRGATVTLDFSVELLETEGTPLPQIPIHWKAVMPEEEVRAPEMPPVKILAVSWSYWNGRGWARLFDGGLWQDVFRHDDKTSARIAFRCPDDMQEAEIGAHTGKWLRVRILRTNQTFGNTAKYLAPRIARIEISYAYETPAARPEELWLKAHLEQKRLYPDGATEIRLLEKPKTECPAACFAFRRPIEDGPVRIAFDQFGESLSFPPALRWEYYGKRNGTACWIEMQVADGTRNFSESGVVSFFFNDPMEPRRLFGETAYWLRAVNTDCRYETEGQPTPAFSSIRLNTVEIRQQETRQAEYFSVARGEKNKLCRLCAGNLISHTVWVNESGALLADDRIQPPDARDARITRDAQGLVAEYWLPWKRVENFAQCGADDRVYRIDEIGGKVLFGDGLHGKIPDITPNAASVRIDYSTGDGARGNCEARAVSAFADPVPFVRLAANAGPVLGGCDAETTEEAIRRCARLASSQNRAVSEADFISLLCGAGRNIARVKLLRGQPPGGLTIAVLPKAVAAEAGHFAAIRRRIRAQLVRQAPLTLIAAKQLLIREADYIEFSLRVAASVASYDGYHDALQAVDDSLRRFLDPITGGHQGAGFPLGQLPAKADLYRCLKATERLERIDAIYIRCAILEKNRRREIDPARAAAYECAVPVSGRHEIHLTVRRG